MGLTLMTFPVLRCFPSNPHLLGIVSISLYLRRREAPGPPASVAPENYFNPQAEGLITQPDIRVGEGSIPSQPIPL